MLVTFLRVTWRNDNFIFIFTASEWQFYIHLFTSSFGSDKMDQTLFGLGNRFCGGSWRTDPNCRLNSGFCASCLNIWANLSWAPATNETDTLRIFKKNLREFEIPRPDSSWISGTLRNSWKPQNSFKIFLKRENQVAFQYLLVDFDSVLIYINAINLTDLISNRQLLNSFATYFAFTSKTCNSPIFTDLYQWHSIVR